MMRKKGFNRLLKLSTYSTKATAFVLAAALSASTVAYAGEGVYTGGDGSDYVAADVESYPSEDDVSDDENDSDYISDYIDEETGLNDMDDEAVEDGEESESNAEASDNDDNNIEDSVVQSKEILVEPHDPPLFPLKTFNANGGIFPTTEATQITVPYGSYRAENPVRDGFTFSHWNTMQYLSYPDDMGIAYDFAHKEPPAPGERRIVYAQWARRVDFRLNEDTDINWGTVFILDGKNYHQQVISTGYIWPFLPPCSLGPAPASVVGPGASLAAAWWRTIDGTMFTSDTLVTDNMVIIMQWTPRVRTSFHLNNDGATWPVGSPTGVVYRYIPYGRGIVSGQNEVFPEPGMPLFPTHPDLIFMGWYPAAPSPGLYIGSRVVVAGLRVTRELAFNARWAPYHTVIMDANGGYSDYTPIRRIGHGSTFNTMASINSRREGSPTDERIYGLGSRVSIDSTFVTRPGYSFHGWNTAADGSGINFLGNTPVNQDMTLYAMWGTPITFVNNHEYFDPNATNQSISRTVILGSSFNRHNQHANMPPPASVAGPAEVARRNTLQMPDFTNWPELATSARAMIGWNSAPDGSGDWFSSATVINETPQVNVFYAVWATGVAFDPGVAPVDSILPENRTRVIANFTSNNTIAQSAGGMPPAPYWPGHNFRGWNRSPDGTGLEYGPNTPITSPTRLYAQWSANITFNHDDGTPPQTIIVYVGNSPDDHGNFPANPDRGPNWYFAGWNTEPDGTGTTITSASEIFLALDVYSQWTTYITFDLGIGNITGDTSAVAVSANQIGIIAGNIPPNPTHLNRTFSHWAWTNPQTGATYKFDPTQPLPDGNITVIAVFDDEPLNNNENNNNENDSNDESKNEGNANNENNNNQGSANISVSRRDPFSRRAFRNVIQRPVRLERENDSDVTIEEVDKGYDYDEKLDEILVDAPEEIIRVSMGSTTIYRGFTGSTNWVETRMDATAFVAEDGSIMIPIRFLTYALRDEVQWSWDASVASLDSGDISIQISPATSVLYINGHTVQITNRFGNVASALIRPEHDRILIPMSALGQAFNIEYEWDADTQTAIFFPNRPLR
ncbi:MAG: InlB B-repeat-containing protein [Defluviitaleaceae bacterium]|nr:InlB B-repeat-containing protein [Defluviitaleaceae bacterium]